MATEVTTPNTDLDNECLSRDWTKTNWRSDELVKIIPWQDLKRSTVLHVAQALYNADRANTQFITIGRSIDDSSERSPADLELHRRYMLDQQGRSVRVVEPWINALFQPDDRTSDNPDHRTTQASTTDYQDADGQGTYTLGLKLNFIVARQWNGDWNSRDPHPTAPGKDLLQGPGDEPYWDTLEIGDAEMWKHIIASAIAKYSDGDIVVIAQEQFEDADSFRQDFAYRQALAYGEDKAGADEARRIGWRRDEEDGPDDNYPHAPIDFHYTLPREYIDTQIETFTDVVLDAMEGGPSLDTDIPPEVLPLLDGRIGYWRHNFRHDIIRECTRALASKLTTSNPQADYTDEDRENVATEVIDRVMGAVYIAQRDPTAIDLPSMRPRYRAWSVSTNKWANLKRVHFRDYFGHPDAGHPQYKGALTTHPVKQYVWMPMELASPLWDQRNWDPVRKSTQSVCHVLRHNLRVHHCALPSLDMTTSIFIGHSSGFTLLELKKIVTLYVLIEKDNAHLHRRRRSTPQGHWPCESLLTRSRLGSVLSQINTLKGQVHDAERILPHPSPATFEYWTAQMTQHIPLSTSFGNAFEEAFFRALWLYTNVSELSRALETTGPPHHTNLAVRCQGRGQRSSHLRTQHQRAHPDSDPYLGDVDRHRGVLEFRQMGQSLDADTILSWSFICHRIVSTARDTRADAFAYSLFSIMSGVPVLEVLGCLHDASVVDRFKEVDGEGGYYKPTSNGVARWDFPFYDDEDNLAPLMGDLDRV
ncbi:hypothetical protein GGR57DRAFT_467737 [Xylariaceae sp. FL1272]|nr:hypothetical protein GGR57DRAFT_467737 [Xylariaceae sp. FL1272]